MRYRFFALPVLALLLSACSWGQSEGQKAELVYFAAEITAPQLASPFQIDKQIQRQLSQINRELARPNIAREELLRGWYYGLESEKKYGTPDSWIWQEEGKTGKWLTSDLLKERDFLAERLLCQQTAGLYFLSCLESESDQCEHVPQSSCRCTEGSGWAQEEGCLLLDEQGEFVPASAQELAQGWYYGLNSQKKKGTPPSWVWKEQGVHSVWRSPFISPQP